MNRDGAGRKQEKTWLRLLPYIMLLLPMAVLNLGFHFLANIQLHWQNRAQDEVALQELEALTRSSSFEYRLNRASGQLSDKLETFLKKTGDQGKSEIKQLLTHIAIDSQACFAPLTDEYKLHIFRKSSDDDAAKLLFVKSNKVASRRAMAMIFDYMIDQYHDKPMSRDSEKQRDKLAETYFGRATSSGAFARSQRGRTTNILRDGRPHWFIWDFIKMHDGTTWGWFLATRSVADNRQSAQKLALEECRSRGHGMAGFVPILDMNEAAVRCLASHAVRSLGHSDTL